MVQAPWSQVHGTGYMAPGPGVHGHRVLEYRVLESYLGPVLGSWTLNLVYGTLYLGYYPAYCTRTTLYLGTPAHLDRYTGLTLVHTLVPAGEGRCMTEVPTRALPTKEALYDQIWPYMTRYGPYIARYGPIYSPIRRPGPYI